MSFAPYLAAAIQYDPILGDKPANLAALLSLTREAAQVGAKLIVHTEMATTGYCWRDRAEVLPLAEPIPGPTTDAFAAIAREHDCYIVVGMPEINPATGILYNSAPLIGPDGVIGNYRKTHAFISEPKWAKDGDLGIPVFDTPIGRIAVTICMDAIYPESFRVPALLGADVIAFPTNWLYEKSPAPAWMARALENGVYVVAANRYGCERGVQFSGGSCVINPDGTLQGIQDTGNGIAYGTIDLAQARTKAIPFDTRRPDTYGDLTLNTYLWNPHDFHGLYDFDPLPEGGKTTVEVHQLEIDPGDVPSNVGAIVTAILDSSADLLVFPELALTGPVDALTAARLAQPIPGPATTSIAAACSIAGRYAVVGIVERASGRLHNTAVLIGPDGPIGAYRAVHLSESDRAWATPGDAFPTFDLPHLRVGILLGHDVHYPEAARMLALHGADLIAWPSCAEGPAVTGLGPTAVPAPRHIDTGPTDDHFHLWRERCRENGTAVAFASAVAPALGWSAIFVPGEESGPRPEQLLHHDTSGSLTQTLDTEAHGTRFATSELRCKDYIGMRMPIWYDILQSPINK